MEKERVPQFSISFTPEQLKELVAENAERGFTLGVETAMTKLSIDNDLTNQQGIMEVLDCSPQKLKEFMEKGLPFTLLGERTYYFSKSEVRKWIVNYNKK